MLQGGVMFGDEFVTPHAEPSLKFPLVGSPELAVTLSMSSLPLIIFSLAALLAPFLLKRM